MSHPPTSSPDLLQTYSPFDDAVPSFGPFDPSPSHEGSTRSSDSAFSWVKLEEGNALGLHYGPEEEDDDEDDGTGTPSSFEDPVVDHQERQMSRSFSDGPSLLDQTTAMATARGRGNLPSPPVGPTPSLLPGGSPRRAVRFSRSARRTLPTSVVQRDALPSSRRAPVPPSVGLLGLVKRRVDGSTGVDDASGRPSATLLPPPPPSRRTVVPGPPDVPAAFARQRGRTVLLAYVLLERAAVDSLALARSSPRPLPRRRRRRRAVPRRRVFLSARSRSGAPEGAGELLSSRPWVRVWRVLRARYYDRS